MVMDMQRITGKTALVGLMGWPVAHSLSPAMHNAAFAYLGLDWAYLPLPVMAGQVEAALRGLVALHFVGFNVTLPHKVAVMPYMDELSPAARQIGAVNTVRIEQGKLRGLNTDPQGFLNSLLEAGFQPHGKRVVLLGAGGSARAVVYALAQAQARSLMVLNRTFARAEKLVRDMAVLFPNGGLECRPLNSRELAYAVEHVDLVVNSTSVGMHPEVADCPWPDDLPMPAGALYYDLIYNPLETLFLARARSVGAQTVNGLGMLVHQGALGFQQWTGKQAPLEVMRSACLEAMQEWLAAAESAPGPPDEG